MSRVERCEKIPRLSFRAKRESNFSITPGLMINHKRHKNMHKNHKIIFKLNFRRAKINHEGFFCAFCASFVLSVVCFSPQLLRTCEKMSNCHFDERSEEKSFLQNQELKISRFARNDNRGIFSHVLRSYDGTSEDAFYRNYSAYMLLSLTQVHAQSI